MELTAILYVIACFVIGVLGRNRRFGFWGFFFCSLFLSPVIGLIVFLATEKRNPCPENKKDKSVKSI